MGFRSQRIIGYYAPTMKGGLTGIEGRGICEARERAGDQGSRKFRQGEVSQSRGPKSLMVAEKNKRKTSDIKTVWKLFKT